MILVCYLLEMYIWVPGYMGVHPGMRYVGIPRGGGMGTRSGYILPGYARMKMEYPNSRYSLRMLTQDSALPISHCVPATSSDSASMHSRGIPCILGYRYFGCLGWCTGLHCM